jgi:hypothetical protein
VIKRYSPGDDFGPWCGPSKALLNYMRSRAMSL